MYRRGIGKGRVHLCGIYNGCQFRKKIHGKIPSVSSDWRWAWACVHSCRTSSKRACDVKKPPGCPAEGPWISGQLSQAQPSMETSHLCWKWLGTAHFLFPVTWKEDYGTQVLLSPQESKKKQYFHFRSHVQGINSQGLTLGPLGTNLIFLSLLTKSS